MLWRARRCLTAFSTKMVFISTRLIKLEQQRKNLVFIQHPMRGWKFIFENSHFPTTTTTRKRRKICVTVAKHKDHIYNPNPNPKSKRTLLTHGKWNFLVRFPSRNLCLWSRFLSRARRKFYFLFNATLQQSEKFTMLNGVLSGRAHQIRIYGAWLLIFNILWAWKTVER